MISNNTFKIFILCNYFLYICNKLNKRKMNSNLLKNTLIFSLALILVLLSSKEIKAQGVAINTDGTDADASSMLDVKATGKGMLIPRMLWGNRPAAPVEGLLIYSTDGDGTNGKGFYYYDGVNWQKMFDANGDDNDWTDVGDYLIPADDTDELTKVYETASPTSRVRAYTSGTGDYAFGDLGYFGTAIGSTSRHIGIYGNSGVGSGNVAVAGRYSAGRIGYIAGERYAIYGKFDEDATGLTSSYGAYFVNDNDENNASFSKYGIYGDVTASNGKKYAIYGSAQNAGDNYGVYGKAFNGTNNYGGYFEGTNYGVYGISDNGHGGYFKSTITSSDKYGIYGECATTDYYGYGGYFV
ncbi:MAG: hypothetical protein U9Q98_08850, partial [Bacteroidota bacterium]|nr:hypothetical protein [Bacteroidota bacterium]